MFCILRRYKSCFRPNHQPEYMFTHTSAPQQSTYTYDHSLKRYVPEEPVLHSWDGDRTYATASRRRSSFAPSHPYSRAQETSHHDTRYSKARRPTVPSFDSSTGRSGSTFGESLLRCDQLGRADRSAVGATTRPVPPAPYSYGSAEATRRDHSDSHKSRMLSSVTARPMSSRQSHQVSSPSRTSRASRIIEPVSRAATIQPGSNVPRRFTVAEVTTTRRPEPVGLPKLHVDRHWEARDPAYKELLSKAEMQDQSGIEVYEESDGAERR